MLVRIIQGRLLVLELRTRCLQLLFVRCRLLLRGRSRLNSSRTVIASSVTADRPVVEDRSEYDVWFRHDTALVGEVSNDLVHQEGQTAQREACSSAHLLGA